MTHDINNESLYRVGLLRCQLQLFIIIKVFRFNSQIYGH